MSRVLRFDLSDLKAFAEASADRNPLHVSADYARKSPFGEPVVFGILGVLKAIAGVEFHRPEAIGSVSVEFRAPMFIGVDYFLEVGQVQGNQVKATVLDAGRPILTAKLRYLDTEVGLRGGHTEGMASRTTATRLETSDLVDGLEVGGRYAPSPAPFADLLARCGLASCGNTGSPLAALLLLSYVVGMELPGERAVFSSFKMHFVGKPSAPVGPFDYVAQVDGYHKVYDRLEITTAIAMNGEPFANASIAASVRPDSPRLRLDRIAALLPPSEALRGRSALVIGGSRGLGAALVAALASQGCKVWLNYRSSRDEAEALIARIPADYGVVQLAAGDASDQTWCREWSQTVKAHEGLDYLICNAVPAIRPIPFGLDSMSRLRSFVDESLTLVANPLASFGPFVDARGGCCVVTSSSYAADDCEDLPPDLHHYVSSKRAIEGLAFSLSSVLTRTKFLVIRPPRFLTDQTNSRAARIGARAVEDVAATVIGTLINPTPGQNLALLDEFPASIN